MATIIVTGGAGYIGSHTLIELLTGTNHHVVSIDNHSNSGPDSYARVKQITNKDLEVLNFDLCDETLLQSKLAGYPDIEAIIHFAAFKSVPDSMRDPVLYYENNLRSLTNLLQFCKNNRVGKFIFSSSCSVYGNPDKLPVTEETPLKKAESPYGHTKQVCEDILRFFCMAEPWFNTVLLRYFNPVGAHPSGLNGEVPLGPPTNLLPVVTQTALGLNSLTVHGDDYDTRDGSCIRDYVHVCDVAEAHVKAVEFLAGTQDRQNLEIFNLGTGNGITVLEVIHSFENTVGKKLQYNIGPRRAGDVVEIYADNNRAKKLLKWQPRYKLDDMTSSAWKWQLNLAKSASTP